MQIPRIKPKISCLLFAATYFCTGTNTDGCACTAGSSKIDAGMSALAEPSTALKSVECRGRAFETNAATASNFPFPNLSGLLSGPGLRADSSSTACRRENSVIHRRICARASSERRRNLRPPHFFVALVQTTSPHASIRSRRLSENQKWTGPFGFTGAKVSKPRPPSDTSSTVPPSSRSN